MAPGDDSSPGRPCPELEELAALLDGTAEPPQRKRLIRHLMRCSACYEVVIESAGNLEALRNDGMEDDGEA